ncbi:MAG: phosphatidylglycerol lysyltransferase domain-containing protein [Clostridiales bacterium]
MKNTGLEFFPSPHIPMEPIISIIPNNLSKYNSKRNHINRFYAQYPNFSFQPLTTKLIPGCQELMTKWYDTKALNNDIIMEKKGIDDAFANFGDLDYLGACLLVQDRVIAFTLGEPLNQDTVAIHVEKADSDYHGAFSLINQLFVKEYWLDYPFINRAEDMGQEGLRMAKESYHPCKMIMKYHLRLKEENKL